MKITALYRSRKGVDTAPFLLIFCALIIVISAAIVLPSIADYKKAMDVGAAVNEMQRLDNAINEMKSMGYGSMQRMEMDVPSPFCIHVEDAEGKVKIVNDPGGVGGDNYICGRQSVILVLRDKLYVYKK